MNCACSCIAVLLTKIYDQVRFVNAVSSKALVFYNSCDHQRAINSHMETVGLIL